MVGDSLNGFTDALGQQKAIDRIHMRHEEGAAFAAAAEAHVTGKPAVRAVRRHEARLRRSRMLGLALDDTEFGLPNQTLRSK